MKLKTLLKESHSTVYNDWDEFKNPDYILVHLKDGRKLQISKKGNNTKMYQTILQAFIDDRTDITDPIVKRMAQAQ